MRTTGSYRDIDIVADAEQNAGQWQGRYALGGTDGVPFELGDGAQETPEDAVAKAMVTAIEKVHADTSGGEFDNITINNPDILDRVETILGLSTA